MTWSDGQHPLEPVADLLSTAQHHLGRDRSDQRVGERVVVVRAGPVKRAPQVGPQLGKPGDTFDFALDLPFQALRNNSNDKGLDTKQFQEGIAAYGGGGRIADGRRWLADVVDEPDRFEITIHGRGKVSYAGGGTSDVTIRRTRKFKAAPGDNFTWENRPLKGGKAQSGKVVADAHGLVTLPAVSFQDPSRLKVVKTK